MGEIVFRTFLGEKTDGEGFFKYDILWIYQHHSNELERISEPNSKYVGPFCYTPWELDLPF